MPDIGQDPATLAELLWRRARDRGEAPAYLFQGDRGAEAALSFAELAARAGRIAAAVGARAEKGDRALLLFSPGTDFVVGFFGCILAGVVAVPVALSRRGAIGPIVADCAPALALTDATPRPETATPLDEAGVPRLALDAALEADPKGPAHLEPEDIALLQYTSGSTSAPKGVIVTHANLLANSAMIRDALGNTARSTHVSWVPHYHDMGLILNLVQTLFLGALCVILAPAAFLRRPLAWLQAISDHRAEVATAPDFAYDLCARACRPEAMAGIDLSSWRVALNGAEPVRAATLDRFAASFAPWGFDPAALYPAYGMAEATLLISAGRRGAGPVRRPLSRAALQDGRAEPPSSDADAYIGIGCGRALDGEMLALVEPESGRRLPSGRIGEIWAAGPHIAGGYWRQPEATAETFAARIEGETGGPWLRTGDLGFLDAAGELFITGRRKDVIVIRGINHYPQDIEATVAACHAGLAPHGGAAFSAVDAEGAERLVVVHEVVRGRRHGDTGPIVAAIREAVSREHDLAAWRVVLLRPGGLPKTTSGKVQRSRARQLWSEGRLDAL